MDSEERTAMNRKEFAAWEQRIADRATLLWEEAGQPEGPRDRFVERAREQIAIGENPRAGKLDPQDAAEPVIEEASLIANLGEFESYSDRQGEEPAFPDPANKD
jgi:Protein of unknown function (DUF2934)